MECCEEHFIVTGLGKKQILATVKIVELFGISLMFLFKIIWCIGNDYRNELQLFVGVLKYLKNH